MTTHTVLYVEDNADNIHLVRRILRLRPHVELLVATEGDQALATAGESLPSLILLDLRLPGLGGQEVLQRLKSANSTSSIPVVVVSGDSGQTQHCTMLGLGAEQFLTKPFELDEFLAVIDRFCQPREVTFEDR